VCGAVFGREHRKQANKDTKDKGNTPLLVVKEIHPSLHLNGFPGSQCKLHDESNARTRRNRVGAATQEQGERGGERDRVAPENVAGLDHEICKKRVCMKLGWASAKGDKLGESKITCGCE
jgi:hypothetical protein